VDPDTHIDSIEQAEEIVLEGTSKWSCKIAITGIMASRDKDHAATTFLIKEQSNTLRQKTHETCTSLLFSMERSQ
jgi:hypothetical protein